MRSYKLFIATYRNCKFSYQSLGYQNWNWKKGGLESAKLTIGRMLVSYRSHKKNPPKKTRGPATQSRCTLLVGSIAPLCYEKLTLQSIVIKGHTKGPRPTLLLMEKKKKKVQTEFSVGYSFPSALFKEARCSPPPNVLGKITLPLISGDQIYWMFYPGWTESPLKRITTAALYLLSSIPSWKYRAQAFCKLPNSLQIQCHWLWIITKA